MALALLQASGLNAQEESVTLFDGKTLTGWTQRGGKAEYAVEDGEIVGSTVPKTPNSFLCTKANYENFILELDFKVHPELNSGVQIRSNSLPEYKNGRVHGYQVEIDPSDRGWTAGIYDEARRGWLNDLHVNRKASYAFRQNGWNHLKVEAIGDRIRTWINGVPAANLKDSMTKTGFIALQIHGVGNRTNKMQVRWKNIKLTKTTTPSAETKTPTTKKGEPLFPAVAEIEKLAGGFRFTEGPALGPDDRIYFNDIPNQTTHVFDPKTGKTSEFRNPTGRANGLFWTPNDALISCEGRAARHPPVRWQDQGAGRKV